MKSNCQISVFEVHAKNTFHLTMLENVPLKIYKYLSEYVEAASKVGEIKALSLEASRLGVLFGYGFAGRKLKKELLRLFPRTNRFAFIPVENQPFTLISHESVDLLSGVAFQIIN